jgi:nucleolar protein 9
MQADRKRIQDRANAAVPSDPHKLPTTPPAQQFKRKRKAQPEDEIEAVFNATLGKRIKKAALDSGDILMSEAAPQKERPVKGSRKEPRNDGGLQDVLGAIRAAPKDEKSGKKRH